jgi:urease accessory protein
MVAELVLPVASEPQTSPRRPTVAVQIGRDRLGQSFVHRQFATYPFRLSRDLRLGSTDTNQTYLYLMNAAPGLLAGDDWWISVQLNEGTSLYLTDQSATKVHRMAIDERARTVYDVSVGKNATLEFVPEPLILYGDAALEQTTTVKLHSTSQLFLSEMIVPGRLARGETYQFQQCLSRLQVYNHAGDLLFADTQRLLGKRNPFQNDKLFATFPVLATVIVVLPMVDLSSLMSTLESIGQTKPSIVVASSQLPNCNGLLIRAMAETTSSLKNYIRDSLNCVRQLTGQPVLPEIPK